MIMDLVFKVYRMRDGAFCATHFNPHTGSSFAYAEVFEDLDAARAFLRDKFKLSPSKVIPVLDIPLLKSSEVEGSRHREATHG
jgi:hypothetical protein